MASTYHKIWWSVFLIVLLSNRQHWVEGAPQVPCYFILGDSLSDSGNNNGLDTKAKANFSPYGIDFPQGPTGRFTNGRTIVDVTSQLLGFDGFIPSFVTAKGQDVLQGVNYASGAAGIRDETGQHLGDRFTLNEQLKNYQLTVTQIISLLGSVAAAGDLLKKCIFTVGIGSNDYINNYFLPNLYQTSKQFTPDQYASALVDQYSSHLKTLHEFGARKVALFGLGLIGCSPAELDAFPHPNTACVDGLNAAVVLFNNKLKSLVNDLNNQFQDSKFTFIDVFSIGSGDPKSAGFKVTDSGCCGGRTGCKPSANPCPNRNEFVFWDEFHPTEAVNLNFAGRAYKKSAPSDATPVDISTLATL